MIAGLPRPSYHQGFARSAGESANPGLWKGLAGFWPTGLGNSGSTVFDPLNSNGATTGATWAIGKFGHVLDYGDSTDTFTLEVASNPRVGLDGATSASWMACFFARGLGQGGDGRLLDKDGATTNNNWGHTLHLQASNSLRLAINATLSNWNKDSATNIYSLNTWVHVVVTWKGSSRIEFWIDGVLADSSTTSIAAGPIVANTEVLRIGLRKDDSRAFDGLIGDTGIWDRVLAGDEIRQLYKNPLAMFQRRSRVIGKAPAAGGGFQSAWAANSNAVIQGGVQI